MHYYQFNIADYRKDTTHLSRVEHSIYRDLIDWCYLDEAPIPLDLTLVKRRLRISSTDDEQALSNVLTDFFERTDEGYTQNRIKQEIDAFHLAVANASKAGKASAEARKNRLHEQAFNDRSTTVQPTNNQEPITNNQEPVKEQKTRAPRFDAQAHLVGMGVEPSIAADWIQSRKALKAAPTQTAIDGISREAAKARIALSDALAMCCQRGWRGFKAEWIGNGDQEHGARNAQPSRRPTIHDERAYTAAALTGRIPASTTIEEFMAGNVPGGAQGGMKLIEGEVIHAS